MRGVRDQGALPLLRLRQPGEHVVQRQREVADLVPRLGYRQVGRHRGRRDPRRAPAQRADRAQRRAGHQPDRPGEHEEEHRGKDHQGPRHHAQRPGRLAERHGRDHQLPAPGGHHHDPQQRRHVKRRTAHLHRPATVRERARLGKGHDRHQPVPLGGHVRDRARGAEHLDRDVRGDRHGVRQPPVGVDQRLDLDRARPRGVVDRPGQRHPQCAEEQQVRGGERDQEAKGGGERDPGPQPAPPPPPEDDRTKAAPQPPLGDASHRRPPAGTPRRAPSARSAARTARRSSVAGTRRTPRRR